MSISSGINELNQKKDKGGMKNDQMNKQYSIISTLGLVFYV